MKKIFMFPGQGSQYRGMGRELFDNVLEFVAAESQIDEILGYSLRQLCVEDTQSQLKETQYTQPCLYVVNALHYYKMLSDGVRPDVVIGHSLGEYNALLAAGAFDLLTGLRLVKRRGELMSQVRNGGMAAVIDLDATRITPLLQKNQLLGIDVANFNSPSQTVISGPVDEIRRATLLLESAGASMCVSLPVSTAFHSRYMANAAAAFDEFLAGFAFRLQQIRVVANVTGQGYPEGDPTTTIRKLLVKQITQPVLWTLSIRKLLLEGPTQFHEIGPGTVLTKLVQQIQKA